MAHIHVMTDALASQVAAGEVVERPASVVKELVENSLDAGAREVRVDVQRGGVALVKVGDDGAGMNREDALLSLERHATSKLRSKDDLIAIGTLGFRGEALPSIGSVSRFRLTTREGESVSGTEIVVEGGKVRDVRDAGCPPGTTVEVRDLFFNVPARRKFLRRESTEAAHIDHQVRLHALAAAEVRFVLRKDGREALDVAASSDRRVRIGDLFGRDLLPNLREIPGTEREGMAARGYLLPPDGARRSRRGQYLFLNGRPVEDRAVARAFEEGFRGSLPPGKHPVGWLWIEMDPALVDVNVHPAKREVRFHRPADVRALIMEAVEQALRTPAERTGPSPGEGSRTVGSAPPADRPAPTAAGELLVGEEDPAAPVEAPEAQRWRSESQPDLPGESAPGPGPAVPGGAPSWRMVGVVQGRYVLLEGSDSLVLMEGEAARERILYESFLASARKGEAETQGLLVPVLLELEARDADVVLRNAANFAEAGMEVESFGGVTVQLRSLPALLADADPKALLLEMVDGLVASAEARSGRVLAFEKFASELARVGARGERCRTESAQRLLEDLFACDLPYCTPGGRPTLVQMASSELARRFGRV